MSTSKTIYLDLDGVMVSFAIPALKVHGIDLDMTTYPRGSDKWDIVGVCNEYREYVNLPPIAPDVFWNKFSEYFWRTLPMFVGARDFANDLCQFVGGENICIATSATLQPACAAGKVAWIQHNLPGLSRQYFIGPTKKYLARPGAILIDDNDKNCNEFIAAGGRAILVPRPWNALHQYTEIDVYEYVLTRLNAMNWREEWL